MALATSWAPRKLILFGEHSVVIGLPALAVPIDTAGSRCLLKRGATPGTLSFSLTSGIEEKSELTGSYAWKDLDALCSAMEKEMGALPGRLRTPKPPLEGVGAALRAAVGGTEDAPRLPHQIVLFAMVALAEPGQALEVRVESDFGPGGLGGSASLAAALTAALLSAAGEVKRPLAEECRTLVNDWAFASETIAHGKPSGIDNTVCVFGRPVVFSVADPVESLLLPAAGLRLLLVDSQVAKCTKTMVNNTMALAKAFPAALQALVCGMGEVALAVSALVKAAVERGHWTQADEDGLKTMIRMNQGLLYGGGASHPELNKIISIAQENGFAGKLSGSGGGGVAYVLLHLKKEGAENVTAEEEERETGLKKQLKAAGYPWHFAHVRPGRATGVELTSSFYEAFD